MPESNANGNGDGNSVANKLVPAKSSVLSAKKDCPLCLCRNREFVDNVIAELRDNIAPIVDRDTGEDIEPTEGITYTKIEQSVRSLLDKLGDTTEFTFPDLVVHAGEHTLISQLAGLKVRSEGNYLIVGNDIYQKIDPKDALSLGISVGAGKLLSGEMKLTATGWVNMMALLWRMQGNLGSDEFIQAMIEKTQMASVSPTSPLGASYLERQQKLAQKHPPLQKEEELEAQEETGIKQESNDATTG